MQLTLSTKGQLVLPAPLRRALGLRARSRVSVEERDGGILLRPVRSARAFAPIEYLPAGAIKLTPADYALDRMAGEDDEPGP